MVFCVEYLAYHYTRKLNIQCIALAEFYVSVVSLVRKCSVLSEEYNGLNEVKYAVTVSGEKSRFGRAT